MRLTLSRPWLAALFWGAMAVSSCTSDPGPAASPGPYADALPPLPFSDFPASRPPEVVKAVYEYAARHPEVLRYVPCFCGCERQGHKGNDDCFVAGRDATGRPQWEPHGMT